MKQPFLSEFGFGGGSTGTTDVTSGSGAGLPKLVHPFFILCEVFNVQKSMLLNSKIMGIK